MDKLQAVFEFTACLRLLNAGIIGMCHTCPVFGVIYFTSQPRGQDFSLVSSPNPIPLGEADGVIGS